MRIQMPLALLAASFFAAACTVSFPTTDQGAPVDTGPDPVDVSSDQIVTTDADVTGVDVADVGDVTSTDLPPKDLVVTDNVIIADIPVIVDVPVTDTGCTNGKTVGADCTTDCPCVANLTCGNASKKCVECPNTPNVAGGLSCDDDCQCILNRCVSNAVGATPTFICKCDQKVEITEGCKESCQCVRGLQCNGTSCVCNNAAPGTSPVDSPCEHNCECKSGTCSGSSDDNRKCQCKVSAKSILPGLGCTEDCECSSGRCLSNSTCSCVDSTQKAIDCPSGYFCDFGSTALNDQASLACLPLQGPWVTCKSSSNCISNWCNSGNKCAPCGNHNDCPNPEGGKGCCCIAPVCKNFSNTSASCSSLCN
jgi:hypothetical protein